MSKQIVNVTGVKSRRKSGNSISRCSEAQKMLRGNLAVRIEELAANQWFGMQVRLKSVITSIASEPQKNRTVYC